MVVEEVNVSDDDELDVFSSLLTMATAADCYIPSIHRISLLSYHLL